jgi:hypothetical protein
MFALGQVVLHRRRLYRQDVVIDSGLALSQAGAPRVLAPELAVFLSPDYTLVKQRMSGRICVKFLTDSV